MTFNPPVILAILALTILGGIAGAMLVLPIPPANAQSVTFILGALAGALTMQGTARSAAGTGVAPDPKDPAE